MAGGVLKEPIFFLLTTALKDRPQGPPTANRQPPTATNRQPPTAANRHQSPTTHPHQPPIANHQPQPTAINHHQPPTANRTNCQPRTANHHQPWLNISAACGLFAKLQFWNTFFFPLRTALPDGAGGSRV